MELHPEPVSLQEVAEGVVATLKSLAAKKQLRVESDFSADLPLAWADPPRLKQILYNLLSNAIKFTPPGGCVSVTARPVAGSRRATGERGSGGEGATAPAFLEVSVTDTGIGFPGAPGAHLSEFEQVVDTTLPGRGTGLGFPGEEVLSWHGDDPGSSTPGGSAFVFTIPTAP
jgi:signal transduction histidine kinase